MERWVVSNPDSLSREELIGIILEQHQAIPELREAVDTLTERVRVLEKENEELRSKLGGGSGTAPACCLAACRRRVV